jgi:hypothetical protein
VDNEIDSAMILAFSSGLFSAQQTGLDLADRGVSVWRIGKNIAGSFFINAVQSGNTVLFFDQNAPGSSIHVDGAGNVGMGTNVPAARLHVVGTARIEGNDLRVDNNADNDTTVTIDSGASTSFHSHFVFADRGNDTWLLCKPPANTLFLQYLPDGGPLVTFRPNRKIDLDTNTRFQKNTLDDMDIHDHSARHNPGGADELDFSSIQQIGLQGQNHIDGLTLAIGDAWTFVTGVGGGGVDLVFDFSSRSGSTILRINWLMTLEQTSGNVFSAEGRMVQVDSGGTIQQGPSLYMAGTAGGDGPTSVEADSVHGVRYVIAPAEVVTFRLQAQEANRDTRCIMTSFVYQELPNTSL